MEVPSDDFTNSWRYRIGLILIIVGHFLILVALLLPVFLQVEKYTLELFGTFFVSGEILSLTSVVFLGKEGFKEITAKIYRVIKA